MYIKELDIRNFGPIYKLNVKLETDKINIILGNNGSGKTNLFAAIYSVFYNEQILKFYKESTLESQVKLILSSNKKKFNITKRYSSTNSEMILKRFDDINSINAYVDRKKIIFIDGEHIRDIKDLSQSDVERILKFLDEKVGSVEINKRYEDIKLRLKTFHKYIYLSGGEQILIYILNLLSKLESDSILIADSIFEMCDYTIIKMIINLMDIITSTQFILIMTNREVLDFNIRNCNVVHLETTNVGLSPVGYNYKNKLFVENTYKRDKKESFEIIRYCKNQILAEEECRNVEFKEIKGNNPCSSIIDTTPIYIVAYLNSRQTDEGIIKWGINNNRMVTGVVLSPEEKDKIRRRLSEEIKKGEPYISSDLYNIRFSPVISEENEIIKDTYVIEIIVKRHNEQYLFSTGKGEVYIKSEGGKLKLSPLEIQKEILIRTLKYNGNNFFQQ